ncbi:MAG: hypothetical protein HN392_11005 [Anaerolineae bacterium]|jgi:predicted ferric reductase|nr:hypothetical protein [Anaerolineae bacterium]MBT7075330.1 hypothetical protein [Anaerolineae bacterium]MBT7781854.1 hypothetical protein [Anaerolineae bacterium]
MAQSTTKIQEYPDTALSIQSFLFVLLAMGVGTLAAVLILPSWLSQLATSLISEDVKAFWYISRGSGFVGLSLIWLSMVLGLLVTNKMARFWPGVPASFAIHEYVSLLGLAFIILHAIILLGDKYIQYDLRQIFTPFASNYEPVLVGLGQLGFYGMLILSLSFYIRRRIGQKVWRSLHYLSFLLYITALIHSILIGTDTSLPWAQNYYWFSVGSLLFLTIYRIITNLGKRK